MSTRVIKPVKQQSQQKQTQKKTLVQPQPKPEEMTIQDMYYMGLIPSMNPEEVVETVSDDVLELIENSRDYLPEVRLEAVRRMCPCKVKRDVEAMWARLLQMTSDPDDAVRYQVLHSLCDGAPKAREEEVVNAIQSFWNDSNTRIRRSARRALNSYQFTGVWNIL